MSARRTSHPAPVRILVVGPKYSSANSRGGMASVVTVMRERADDRVRVRTVATYIDDTRVRRAGTGVVGVAAAVFALLARRVDVVHVHLAHRGSVVRKAVVLWAARLVRIPAVVHAHSYNFGAWFDGLGARAQWLVRRALPADRWLVLGDSLVVGYATRLRLAEDRVFVLRNPVLPADRLPADEPGARDTGVVTALFLGRHGARKGSFDLVAAVAEVVRADAALRTRLRVLAAGDGEVDAVREAAATAGVADVLQVSGWVPADVRNQLLAAADAFVLPSYDEGLPMALLEAMGSGLAPIVTPVGAIPEVTTDEVDALVVGAGDVPALAAALRRVATDHELRTRLGAAARQRASDLGVEPWWEVLVDHWHAVLR